MRDLKVQQVADLLRQRNAASSRGTSRPWRIESVYLFDVQQLLAELRARGVKIGTASSVRAAQWAAAEIYPRASNQALPVRPEQAELLRLYAPTG
ncbi:hypothetical protein [Nonomuraea cavernae]|uniref:hypothetical protein n=1 Tax=Nonomuraea cavernae TaxID=2045107 RepID=UPI0033EFB023